MNKQHTYPVCSYLDAFFVKYAILKYTRMEQNCNKDEFYASTERRYLYL